MKIFHRDLKSANVFLYKDGTAKLGDLNVSKVAKRGMLYTQTGTPYYASPEVWRDQPYDSKSDVWSLGCVLYEMTSFKTPFRAQDMKTLYEKVLKGLYPRIPQNYSVELSNLIKGLLQVSPNFRPSCDQILKMKMINKKMEQLNILPEGFNPVTQAIDEPQEELALLNTIRVPRNLTQLTKALPKSNYTKERGESKSAAAQQLKAKQLAVGDSKENSQPPTSSMPMVKSPAGGATKNSNASASTQESGQQQQQIQSKPQGGHSALLPPKIDQRQILQQRAESQLAPQTKKSIADLHSVINGDKSQQARKFIPNAKPKATRYKPLSISPDDHTSSHIQIPIATQSPLPFGTKQDKIQSLQAKEIIENAKKETQQIRAGGMTVGLTGKLNLNYMSAQHPPGIKNLTGQSSPNGPKKLNHMSIDNEYIGQSATHAIQGTHILHGRTQQTSPKREIAEGEGRNFVMGIKHVQNTIVNHTGLTSVENQLKFPDIMVRGALPPLAPSDSVLMSRVGGIQKPSIDKLEQNQIKKEIMAGTVGDMSPRSRQPAQVDNYSIQRENNNMSMSQDQRTSLALHQKKPSISGGLMPQNLPRMSNTMQDHETSETHQSGRKSINPITSVDGGLTRASIDNGNGLTDDDRNYLNKLKQKGTKGAGGYNFTKAPSMKVSQIGSPRQETVEKCRNLEVCFIVEKSD